MPVAKVEGVSMIGVKFFSKQATGTVCAIWGASILRDDVYDDVATLRNLALGGTFFMDAEEPLHIDYDGYQDSLNSKVRRAKKVVFIKGRAFAKGAQ